MFPKHGKFKIFNGGNKKIISRQLITSSNPENNLKENYKFSSKPIP